MPVHLLPPSSYLGPIIGQRPPRTEALTHHANVLRPDGVVVETVVKLFPRTAAGTEGMQLVNELVGHLLCEAWGVPAPPNAGTITLQRAQLRQLPLWKHLSGKHVVAWWSERVAAESLNAQFHLDELQARKALHRHHVEAFAKHIAQFPQCADIVAFDDIIANVDRNAGNLLGPVGQRFIAIDHGHALTGPDWQRAHLNAEQAFTNKIKDILVDMGQWTLPMASRAVAKVDAIEKHAPHAIQTVAAALDGVLGADDLAAVVTFLGARSSRTPATARRLGTLA